LKVAQSITPGRPSRQAPGDCAARSRPEIPEALQETRQARNFRPRSTAWRGLPRPRAIIPITTHGGHSVSVETKAHKAAIGVESVLLKSFVDQMLPKDAVNVFGGGVAGDVWKSMLSEKIANEVAKSGSLKFASRLFETHPDLLHSNKRQGMVQGAAQALANTTMTSNVLAKVSPAAPAPNKI